MKKFLGILLNPFVLGFLLMIMIGGIIWAAAGEKWAIIGLAGIPLGFLARKVIDVVKKK